VIEELADAGAPATAMVRVPARAVDLPPRVDYVVGTLDGPPPPDVLAGFDQVLLLSPSRDWQVELEVYFIDALIRAGHQPHVVKIAQDGFQDPDCGVRFMRNHRQVAMHLDGTGLPVTYIAPNLYMDNLVSMADTIRDSALLPAPAGEGRIGFVATSDVAAVAAHALLTGDQEGAVHTVTGPEALSYTDVADRISTVFARHVDYADLPADQARAEWQAARMPQWQVDGMLELFEWVRAGGASTVTSDVRDATGRDPRPIQDWLQEMRGAFVGRPAHTSPPRL
jgi:uncharacterized protein YbjT (DUF2867 family)